MSVVAGVDYSSKFVDVVLVDIDTPTTVEWHRYDLGTTGDAFDRTRRVRDALPSRGWWRDQGVIAIGIEDPRGHSAGVIYRVQGGILQCLPPELLVHPWIPSAWRKTVGLPGNCDKRAIQIHSQRLLEVTPGIGDWTADAHDAHLIGLATLVSLDVFTEEAA